MRARLLLGLAALLAAAQPGQAADLVVLGAAAVRASLAEVPAGFAAATGHHVQFTFGTAGAIKDKVVAGEPVDVVIVPPLQLADLAKQGLVVEGSRTDLGVARLGVAVKAGTASPAMATADTLKQAFLEAPSLAWADPASGATTGIYLTKLAQQLGLTEAIKGKLKLYPDGTNAMEAVARGEVFLGAGQISEIRPVKGVDLAAPLPEALQLKTIYAAGLAARSPAPDAARALIAYLSSPKMAPVFKASGFDPP